jgi:hypothetical protein
MKNKVLFLPIFALLLVACAPPLLGSDAAPLLAVSADGLFTGSAEDFLLTEEELNGDFVRAFVVDRVDLYREPFTTEKRAYAEAVGLLSSWGAQFAPPAGNPPFNGLPTYIKTSASIYSSTEGPHVGMSPNWASGIYEFINVGKWTQLPSIADLGAESFVVQEEDGTIRLVVFYRNLSFGISGKMNHDGGDLYLYLSDLARSHLEWIKAHEHIEK